MQCNIDKNSIRERIKALRKNQPQNERRQKSEEICRRFVRMPEFKNAKVVSLYMSAFGEVDTSFIIKTALNLNKTVAVPVIDKDDINLSLYTEELTAGAYGISEPARRIYVNPNDVDLFLVPGIAFDKSGNRIGFGKGYYDRLLEGAKGVKVGCMYDFQLVDIIPAEKTDIKMDYLVCESQVHRCE